MDECSSQIAISARKSWEDDPWEIERSLPELESNQEIPLDQGSKVTWTIRDRERSICTKKHCHFALQSWQLLFPRYPPRLLIPLVSESL